MIDVEDILHYWSGPTGIHRIAPPNQWDIAPTDVVRLMCTCRGKTCEVGCGIGRLAAYFRKDSYVGVDINGEAIRVANNDLPTHTFAQIPWGGALPTADTYLLWTVALHVPDEVIRGFLAGMDNRIVIVESMDRTYRTSRFMFQRDPEEYQDLLKSLGYGIELYERISIPNYPHHQDWIIAQKEKVQ